MLSDDELKVLLGVLLGKINTMFPDDPEMGSGFTNLSRSIAMVASEVFVEGVKEYEKLKSESQDSVD